MRLLFSVLALILLCPAAQAQPLYTLQDMINTSINQCVQQRGAQAQAFCTCWVNHWVGLWDANDREVWSRTGSATRHMSQMEGQAARDCGG
jgi:hypothetical protein